MYAPFSALHPTPSHLTSTTSASGTAATESMDVSESNQGEDEYVTVDDADFGEFLFGEALGC
jgi:hypothetical protein